MMAVVVVMMSVVVMLVVVKMFGMLFHMEVVRTVVMMGFVEEVEYHAGVLGWKYFALQSNILEAHL